VSSTAHTATVFLVAFFGVVVGVPIALLLWRRRAGHPGAPGTDPAANRDIGSGGVPRSSPWGGGGGSGSYGGGSSS
jgi:hypothetical protein